MTHSRIPRAPAPTAALVAGLLAAGWLAVPAAAQPILIPLSPQTRDQSSPRPEPVPVPIAPPQADATDAPPTRYGATPDARVVPGTERTGRAEPAPPR